MILSLPVLLCAFLSLVVEADLLALCAARKYVCRYVQARDVSGKDRTGKGRQGRRELVCIPARRDGRERGDLD